VGCGTAVAVAVEPAGTVAVGAAVVAVGAGDVAVGGLVGVAESPAHARATNIIAVASISIMGFGP
jgi:hypothetical protein